MQYLLFIIVKSDSEEIKKNDILIFDNEYGINDILFVKNKIIFIIKFMTLMLSLCFDLKIQPSLQDC